MAEVKITDLVELNATPDDADLLEIVDVGGTPTSKKITVANLMGGLAAPWLIDVNVFTTLPSVNWATLVANSSQVMGGYRQSTNSQNCYIEFPVVLSAGTWTFSLVHFRSTDVGIYTLTIDGDSKGTIDGYNAGGPQYNILSEITGIAVATAGKKVIRLTMATKNASSSGYYGAISAIRLVRTA